MTLLLLFITIEITATMRSERVATPSVVTNERTASVSARLTAIGELQVSVRDRYNTKAENGFII